MTVLRFATQFALGIALTAYIVRRDLRTLSPRRLSRSWGEASFWAAVAAFGPLCIPVHFAKTRRSVFGFLLGVLWMLAELVVLSVIDAGLEALAG